MTEENYRQTYDLAQSAARVAGEAHVRAERAERDIQSHENICSERYGRINEQLGELKVAHSKASDAEKHSKARMFEKLENLSAQVATLAANAATKNTTTDDLLRWGCLIIGAGGIIFGVIK